MLKWVKTTFLVLILSFSLGCASTQSSRSVQPIKSLAAKRGKSQTNPVLKTSGEIIQHSGEAFVWVIKELLMPLDFLRKGLINLFGVSEETVVQEKNLPPSVYRNRNH